MSRRWSILGLLLVLSVGLGAYQLTVATRTSSQPAAVAVDATDTLTTWLHLSADQREKVRSADPTFAGELAQLKSALALARADLAALLEKPSATNEQIEAGVERVIAADNALERRVTKYLLSVREHLSVEQQQRLLSLCAEEVRRGRGYQWGRQGGEQERSGHGPAAGRGRHGRGPRGGPGQ